MRAKRFSLHDDPTMTRQPLTTWQRTWWQVCAVVMLITAAACWWQWAWHLDQLVYDAAQSTWTHPTPDDIVIVAIDDASVKAIGRWPWKRAIHAQAIDQITRAGPKAILLDLLLSEPDSDPQQDALLAQAMKRSGKVVLPVSHAMDGTNQGHELAPVTPLRQTARLAHADAALDADGSLRWAYMWAGAGEHLYPHPALALMQAANEAPSAMQHVPSSTPASAPASWNRQTPVAVPYLGPPGRILQVSYAMLLRGELPASTFHNRYVLIGAAAHGLGEIFQTPVSQSGGGMTGVEVIAQLLASMTSGREIRAMPEGWNALISALLVGLLLSSFQHITPRQALLAVMSTAGGAVLLSWGLMAQSLWWPPCGLALGALMSYPMWSWRRLETTARDLEAELRALSAEPDVHLASPAHRCHQPGHQSVATGPPAPCAHLGRIA
jgi:CHASE2 domain-containing sensor protein